MRFLSVLFSLLLIPGFMYSSVINVGKTLCKPIKSSQPAILPRNNQGKVFLLTSRDSGSHFFMYCTQFFTHQVWQTPNAKYSFFNDCRDDSNNHLRAHESGHNLLYNESNGYYFTYSPNDKLILLVRNLKDHIFKKEHATIRQILKSPINQRAQRLSCLILGFTQPNICQKGSFLFEYFRNIDTYLSWNKSNRIIVKYDDLIHSLERTLKTLSVFMGFKLGNSFNLFMKQSQEHRVRCSTLTRKWNGSSARANHTLSYLDNPDFKEFSELVDEVLRKNHPKYFRFLKVHKCI